MSSIPVPSLTDLAQYLPKDPYSPRRSLMDGLDERLRAQAAGASVDQGPIRAYGEGGLAAAVTALNGPSTGGVDPSASLRHYQQTGELKTAEQLAADRAPVPPPGAPPRALDGLSGSIDRYIPRNLAGGPVRAPERPQTHGLRPPDLSSPSAQMMLAQGRRSGVRIDDQGRPVDPAGQTLSQPPIQPEQYGLPHHAETAPPVDASQYTTDPFFKATLQRTAAALNRHDAPSAPTSEGRSYLDHRLLPSGERVFPTETGSLHYNWGPSGPPSAPEGVTPFLRSHAFNHDAPGSLGMVDGPGGPAQVASQLQRDRGELANIQKQYGADTEARARAATQERTAANPDWQDESRARREIAVAEAQGRGRATGTQHELARKYVLSQAREKQGEIESRIRSKQLTPEQGKAMLEKLRSRAGEMLFGLEQQLADTEARKQTPDIFGQPY